MLRLSGLSSGIDTSSIVDALVNATRQPQETALARKQSSYSTELSGLGRIKSALSTLQSAAENLADADSYQKASVSSSNAEKISVSQSGSSYRGEFDVEVLAKASRHQLGSEEFSDVSADLGAGDMTIADQNGNSFTLNLPAGDSSLLDIRDAINGDSNNFGVTASLLKSGQDSYRLVISASESGSANAISVNVSDADGDNTDGAGLSQIMKVDGGTAALQVLSAAEDAEIRLDGTDFTITRSTNVFDDLFEGVALDIGNATVGDTATIAVKDDESVARTQADELVSAINAFVSVSDSLTGTDGQLQGNSLIRGIRSQMRSILGATQSEISNGYSTLHSIGIEFDRYGKASINSSTFSEAFAADANVLKNLMTGDSGIGTKLNERLDDLLDSEGAINSREDSLTASRKRLETRFEDLERRMTSYEERLVAQFTAMESISARFSSIGTFVSSLSSQYSNN